jgi:hypothetical protein
MEAISGRKKIQEIAADHTSAVQAENPPALERRWPIVWLFSSPADGAPLHLLTPQDNRRLERIDSSRSTALAGARSRGAATDIALLNGAMAGSLLCTRQKELTGDGRCRILKLGKSAGLVVYGWFRRQSG